MRTSSPFLIGIARALLTVVCCTLSLAAISNSAIAQNEELYDLLSDGEEMKNLAEDPKYTGVLQEMRSLEDQWQNQNKDLGLADLGNRQPDVGLGAETARAGIKANEPELWERLKNGELMATHAWMKKYKPKKKK